MVVLAFVAPFETVTVAVKNTVGLGEALRVVDIFYCFCLLACFKYL